MTTHTFNYRDYLDRPNDLLAEIQNKFGSTKEEACNQILGTLTHLTIHGKPRVDREKCYEVLMKLGFDRKKIKDSIDNLLVNAHLAALPVLKAVDFNLLKKTG